MNIMCGVPQGSMLGPLRGFKRHRCYIITSKIPVRWPGQWFTEVPWLAVHSWNESLGSYMVRMTAKRLRSADGEHATSASV